MNVFEIPYETLMVHFTVVCQGCGRAYDCYPAQPTETYQCINCAFDGKGGRFPFADKRRVLRTTAMLGADGYSLRKIALGG